MNPSEIKEILDAPEVLFFLPAINLVFLFATKDYSHELTFSLLAIIASTIIYNILTGVPAEKSRKVRLGVTILFAIGFIAWIFLLLLSMIRLYNSFSHVSVIHELLFFSTITLVTIIVINIFLIWYEDQFDTII